MFTLKSYLKKVQEESARILKEADAVGIEKNQLTQHMAKRQENGYYLSFEQK